MHVQCTYHYPSLPLAHLYQVVFDLSFQKDSDCTNGVIKTTELQINEDLLMYFNCEEENLELGVFNK